MARSEPHEPHSFESEPQASHITFNLQEISYMERWRNRQPLQFKLQEKSGAKGSNCYYVPQNVAHVAHSLSMAQSVAQDHMTKRSRYKEIQEM